VDLLSDFLGNRRTTPSLAMQFPFAGRLTREVRAKARHAVETAEHLHPSPTRVPKSSTSHHHPPRPSGLAPPTYPTPGQICPSSETRPPCPGNLAARPTAPTPLRPGCLFGRPTPWETLAPPLLLPTPPTPRPPAPRRGIPRARGALPAAPHRSRSHLGERADLFRPPALGSSFSPSCAAWTVSARSAAVRASPGGGADPLAHHGQRLPAVTFATSGGSSP
jgi:hypothetical protein